MIILITAKRLLREVYLTFVKRLWLFSSNVPIIVSTVIPHINVYNIYLVQYICNVSNRHHYYGNNKTLTICTIIINTMIINVLLIMMTIKIIIIIIIIIMLNSAFNYCRILTNTVVTNVYLISPKWVKIVLKHKISLLPTIPVDGSTA